MLSSLLMGAVTGMRSMTPLAVVTSAARRGELPRDSGAPALLGGPVASVAALVLAAGELLGDKMPSAPDRIVTPGIAARLVTGALAGMALAPRRERRRAAVAGAVSSVGSAMITFHARKAAMRRFGQMQTGLVEDAIAVAGAVWIASHARRASIS